jgi:hypothetical protein
MSIISVFDFQLKLINLLLLTLNLTKQILVLFIKPFILFICLLV